MLATGHFGLMRIPAYAQNVERMASDRTSSWQRARSSLLGSLTPDKTDASAGARPGEGVMPQSFGEIRSSVSNQKVKRKVTMKSG